MPNRGKFIVIEGPDGSGKTEQFNRLALRLPGSANLRTIHFPRYDEPSSYFVREYLAGKYGTLDEMGPKKASLFYALDRYDAGAKQLGRWLEEGKTVVVDRYVGSNMGHQGAKIEGEKERAAFFEWLYELEYKILGIPRPDLNIILHVPAAMTADLRKKRASRIAAATGLDGIPDIHEKDLAYLELAEQVYLEVAHLFPKDFTVIECAPGGKLLSIEEVHEKVWAIVKKILAL